MEERLEESSDCITSLEVFKTICLDKDVLYTALVTTHTQFEGIVIGKIKATIFQY